MPENNYSTSGRHFKSTPQQGGANAAAPSAGRRFAQADSRAASPAAGAHASAAVTAAAPNAHFAAAQTVPGTAQGSGYQTSSYSAAAENVGSRFGRKSSRGNSNAGNGGSGFGGFGGNGGNGYDDDTPRKRVNGKKIALVVLIVVLVLGVAGSALGLSLYGDAKSIMADSSTLISDAKSMKDDIKNFDTDSLNTKAITLAAKTKKMKEKTSGLNWQIASFVPIIGDDIRAARGLVSEADNLMQNAMVPAAAKLADLKPDKLLVDGAINVQSLQDILSTLKSVTPTIRKSTEAIDALPTPHIGKLKDAVNKVKDPLDSASPYLDEIDIMADELPRMLGANGETKSYLLVAQNNAELRSCGGLPGSLGIMTVTDGKIEMGDFTATADLKWYDTTGFGVTDEEVAIFGDRVSTKCNDSNFIPDWSRAAQFIKAIYKDQVGGPDVNGVVGVDPVFLQTLLGLTGGIESAGVSVNGSNAAKLLMHDSYQTMDVSTTDAFFAGVAGSAFKHIMGNLGSAGMGDLVKAVKSSIEQGHFMAYMVDETQQGLMEDLGMAWNIKDDETEPELGVFPTDDTASKISWYFSDKTTVGEGTKNADGTTTYHVTTTMTNHLSKTEAAGLVQYVYGYNPLKQDRTDMIMPVYLVAPAGGKIENLQVSGGDNSLTGFTDTTYNGRQIMFGTVRLGGEETMTYTYDVTVSAKAKKTLAVRTTPTAQTAAGWDTDPQVKGEKIE